MHNYEYIIASLPLIEKGKGLDAERCIEEIRSECTGYDLRCVDTVIRLCNADGLDEAFYREAEKSSCKFIKNYSRFDRMLRNLTTQYLNKRLERPEGSDMVLMREDETPSDENDASSVLEVLDIQDLQERENALDTLKWNKCDELTSLNILDLDVVLAYIVKIKIVDRWLKLDPQKGRERFHTLIEELRKTN